MDKNMEHSSFIWKRLPKSHTHACRNIRKSLESLGAGYQCLCGGGPVDSGPLATTHFAD